MSLRARLALVYGGLVVIFPVMIFAWIHWALSPMLLAKLDRELIDEAVEWDRIYDSAGAPGLRIEFEVETRNFGGRRVFCRFFGPDQALLLNSDMRYWDDLPPVPRGFAVNGTSGPDNALVESLRTPLREDTIRTVYYKDDLGNLYQFGHSQAEIGQFVGEFRRLAFTGGVILLLFGGLSSFFVSKRLLAGLSLITNSVGHVSRGDFSRRIDRFRGPREIDDLGRAFNDMQDRIEALVGELQDVSINIAHDLRTPLARIRSIAETRLVSDTPEEACADALGSILEEGDRLAATIDTMLLISEAESGIVDYTSRETDLRVIAESAAELLTTVAEDKGLTLRTHLPPGPVMVRGHESRLQRVVSNLLENAIKFTPPGGEIDLRLSASPGEVCLEVLDTGVGIPEKDIPRVFDRFYRGDTSRTSEGVGLGLSCVASILRAHGGAIAVKSNPGRQTLFTATLPSATG